MEDQRRYTVPHPERQDQYTKATCPKPDQWFVDGGRCGWAHECDRCADNPDQRPPVHGNHHTEIQPGRCELPKTKIIKVRKFVTLHIYDPIPNNSDGIVIMCWNDPKNSDGLCLTGKWMDFEFEIPMDRSDQCDNCGL